jgi:hypothetical protein
LDILGGEKAMIESPVLKRIVAKSERATRVKDITRFLQARFNAMTPTITAGLEQVKGVKKLDGLIDKAATCLSLEAFEEALLGELPAPAPASTRGKRRSQKAPE